MADAEWIASFSLCMLIILVTIIYMRRKSLERQEAEERARKEKHDAAVAVSLMGGTGGKSLTLTPDQIQRDLDRLCLLFSQATEPPRKAEPQRPPRAAPAEAPKPPAEAPKPRTPPAPVDTPEPSPGAPAPPAEAPKSAPRRLPGTLRTEQRAKPEGPRKGSEHIQSEIEQAVKETQ
ncbi:pollen-specific leucine-rich repeat extensin-like protein 1 [Megalops cyprinoides]|uniref:pollen-specific leucine-rich repeat extensin-like protein 1 n=1 Tax=Megalops cyprinoides TaxID=118141 RepID=UPI0018656052|nr:pollen-specific leucine-rich repeat extensin-like protein 1 [Megalops cyprinoides]